MGLLNDFGRQRRPAKAVDTECRPNPVERASKRIKKLRTISGASPGGSPGGECRRRGELLPTRGALLQIDVFNPRGDIELFVPIPVPASDPKILVKKQQFLNKFDGVELTRR
jgi:hypothetical protein